MRTAWHGVSWDFLVVPLDPENMNVSSWFLAGRFVDFSICWFCSCLAEKENDRKEAMTVDGCEIRSHHRS